MFEGTIAADSTANACITGVSLNPGETQAVTADQLAAPDTTASLTNLDPSTVYQWVVKTFCAPGSNFSSYSGNNLFGTASAAEGGEFSRLSEDVEEDVEINVFPNPTTGQLTVELGNLEEAFITITNLHGQVVIKETINGAGRHNLQLEGANGLYTLEVMTASGSIQVFRVVKE